SSSGFLKRRAAGRTTVVTIATPPIQSTTASTCKPSAIVTSFMRRRRESGRDIAALVRAAGARRRFATAGDYSDALVNAGRDVFGRATLQERHGVLATRGEDPRAGFLHLGRIVFWYVPVA